MELAVIAEGRLLADGSEQIVLSGASTAGRISGYLSLSEMLAGDTLIVRYYIEVNGIFERYHTETYSGLQVDPLVYITPKDITSEMKVTIEQTAGGFKGFRYSFSLEEDLVGAEYKV